MPRRSELKKLLLLLLLPIGFLLLYTSARVPYFVEKAYSNAFFKFIGQVLSRITGIVPFSIAEILVIIFSLFFIIYLVKTVVLLIKSNEPRKHILFRFVCFVAVVPSTLYFTFVICWGLNYSRLPFSTIAHLEVNPTSVNELAELCGELIVKANDLRSRVSEDNRGVMVLVKGKKEALQRAQAGYRNAASTYPELGGTFGNPKPVILSEFMCYTGITGVYFPFTAEANVNMANNDSMLPSTICHEMAHQRGFAREDEANFIAYIACKAHPDADFQYSGYLLALLNSMNALYSHDSEKYRQLSSKYQDGVKRDLRDITAFWQKYEGPVEKISTSINDTYLKANMQNDGVYSYGRMVDLLLAEHRKFKNK